MAIQKYFPIDAVRTSANKVWSDASHQRKEEILDNIAKIRDDGRRITKNNVYKAIKDDPNDSTVYRGIETCIDVLLAAGVDVNPVPYYQFTYKEILPSEAKK